MGLCQRPEIIDSAWAQHLYDNPQHLILFDNISIIAPANGFIQIFRKAFEIKQKTQTPNGSSQYRHWRNISKSYL